MDERAEDAALLPGRLAGAGAEEAEEASTLQACTHADTQTATPRQTHLGSAADEMRGRAHAEGDEERRICVPAGQPRATLSGWTAVKL